MKTMVTVEALDRSQRDQFLCAEELTVALRHKFSSQYATAWKKDVNIRWEPYHPSFFNRLREAWKTLTS